MLTPLLQVDEQIPRGLKAFASLCLCQTLQYTLSDLNFSNLTLFNGKEMSKQSHTENLLQKQCQTVCVKYVEHIN